MKATHTICILSFLLFACKPKQKKESNLETQASQDAADTLYRLDINSDSISIVPPKDSNFYLPDDTEIIRLEQLIDFNADGKKDAFVYLGDCGTGGCMYGIFLKQEENYYSLAFIDYLKGVRFNKEKNGFLSFKSFEEVEAYDPSKLQVSSFKLNQMNMQYDLDTSYISINH